MLLQGRISIIGLENFTEHCGIILYYNNIIIILYWIRREKIIKESIMDSTCY